VATDDAKATGEQQKTKGPTFEFGANAKPAAGDVDGWGIPIQPHAAEAFGTVPGFKAMVRHLRDAQRMLTELADTPGGAFLQKRMQWARRPTKDDPNAGRWIFNDLDNAVKLVEDCTPTYTTCPYLHLEDGRPHPDPCSTCLMQKWCAALWVKQIPAVLIERAKEAYRV
jgi:hypothetical protein